MLVTVHYLKAAGLKIIERNLNFSSKTYNPNLIGPGK